MQRRGSGKGRGQADPHGVVIPWRSSLGAVPSPERQAEHQLFRRYHADGDVAARDELIRQGIPLARKLAMRYSRHGEPVDDLLQVASIGLIKAVDRFDFTRGTAFSSFAVPSILGELKRHFRDHGWATRVARPVQGNGREHGGRARGARGGDRARRGVAGRPARLDGRRQPGDLRRHGALDRLRTVADGQPG